MGATKGNSRTNILNAAEALFAEKGFDATTTREIAQRSGDTLGTLSYHFTSKRKLLQEIFNRRFETVAETRTRYFEEAINAASGKTPTAEGIVGALVLPFIDLVASGDQGWQNYIILLGRTRETGDTDQQQFLLGLSESHVEKYLGWLALIAPRASRKDLVFAYEFSVMIAINTCSLISQKRMSFYAHSKITLEEHRSSMLSYILAGTSSLLDGA